MIKKPNARITHPTKRKYSSESPNLHSSRAQASESPIRSPAETVRSHSQRLRDLIYGTDSAISHQYSTDTPSFDPSPNFASHQTASSDVSPGNLAYVLYSALQNPSGTSPQPTPSGYNGHNLLQNAAVSSPPHETASQSFDLQSPGMPYSRMVDPDTPIYSRNVQGDAQQYDSVIDPDTPMHSRGLDTEESPIYSRAVDPATPINNLLETSNFKPSMEDMTDPFIIMKDKSNAISRPKQLKREIIPETDGIMQVLFRILPKSEAFVPTYNAHRYIERQIEVLRLAQAPNVPFNLQQTMDRMMAAAGSFAQAHLLAYASY